MSRTARYERPSELRALRLLTAVLAATTLAATVGTSFAAGRPDAGLTPDGYRVALLLAIAAPLLAGALAPWSGVRMLRALNAVAVVAFAGLLLAFLFIALPVLGYPADVPWFLTVTAGPVTAALVAAGRTVAWSVLGATTALLQVIRLVAGSDAQDAIANDVLTFFASATFLLLAGRFVKVSRDFDRATVAAREAAARRSEDEARIAAGERLQLLVHDELLSTLSLAARDVPSLREAIARQAARARRLIRELRTPEPDAPPAADLVALLREATTAEDSGVRFEVDDAASTERARITADVGEALAGAARQALANSVAHAGPGARRTVRLRHGLDGVEVVIHDDGVGFDPGAVPGTRMGISASILGRMRALPGGAAHLASATGTGTGTGTGTTVTLSWRSPAEPAEASAARAEAAPPTGSTLLGDGGETGGPGLPTARGYLVAVVALMVAQAVLAALAAGRAGEPWSALLGLGGLALGFVVLGSPRASVPSARRSRLVVAAAAATALVSWLPVTRDPERFGDLWFVAALGYVLLALAMRGRPRAALLGAALVAGLTLGGVAVQPSDGADVVAATTRMLAVVGIGAGFLAGIERVRARTLALRRSDLAAVREAAFRATEREELRGRSAGLEDLIGDVLERLERSGELSAETRRECVMLEGRLRDGYRAGRLARHPLTDAAMDARGRGVDVALFDDPEGRELTEHELTAIAEWMAERLDAVTEGRFTGRVLPEGRAAVASAATNESVAEFPISHP